MCDTVRSNFDEKLPEILKAIDQAAFIAIDTELTGLTLDKRSLFDSAEDRYQLLRKCASNFLVCQIGLSMFIPIREENRYEAACYNIYLFPAAQGITDSYFSCQVASLEFLCDHNFNFNKFIYEGVPYVDRVKEKWILEQFENRSLLLPVCRDINDHKLQEQCTSIAVWVGSAKEGETMEFDRPLTMMSYLIHVELRFRFPTIWTSDLTKTKILIEKVSLDSRKEREVSDTFLKNNFLDAFLGFSRVFKHMVKSKKALVGHNMFLDLLMMYQHFYEPLPRYLTTFKNEIHSMFPVIYDTKHLIFQLRREIDECLLFEGSSLHELYKNFSSPLGRFFALYSPTIEFRPNGENKYVEEEAIHEAGFDSYMAGYVFLRLAHIKSTKSSRVSARLGPLSSSEHLSALSKYANCINIIRGQVNHLNLCGKDPDVQRPEWLVIEPKEQKMPLNLTELTVLMARYGNIDLRLQNRYRALVAVGTFRCAKAIMKGFHEHTRYRVSHYSLFRHSPVVSALLWTGAIVSGSFGLWFSYLMARQSRIK